MPVDPRHDVIAAPDVAFGELGNRLGKVSAEGQPQHRFLAIRANLNRRFTRSADYALFMVVQRFRGHFDEAAGGFTDTAAAGGRGPRSTRHAMSGRSSDGGRRIRFVTWMNAAASTSSCSAAACRRAR